MKNEANVTPTIIKYMQLKGIYGCYEIKSMQRQDSFVLSKFEPQQLESLRSAAHSGLNWKISDADPRLKPCDGIAIPPMRSWVILKFTGSVLFIDSQHFVYLNDQKVKRLKFEAARELAMYELEM